MRIHHNLTLTVHRANDKRRPVTMRLAGLTIQLTRNEAHRLADQLHDTAEQQGTGQ